MQIKKSLLLLGVLILSIVLAPLSYAGKYDAVIEKIVMKKEVSQREAFVSQLEKAISAYKNKINAKSKKTSKDKKILLVLPELEKSVASVKTKLFPENKNTDKDDKKDNTENENNENNGDKTYVKSHNASGIYYRSDLVQSYMEDYNKLSGSVKERREVYIKDAIERNGYSRQYAEQLADLYIGKAPQEVEKGVESFELTIVPKKEITGKNCMYEQQWKSPGVRGEVERVCKENSIVKMKFNYEPWLSSILGFDVYGEETSNHLQINRYLVDYKKGFIVYAEYATHPMYTKSDYFKSNIYTTDIKDAEKFKKDAYDNLIKSWNTKVSDKKEAEYKAKEKAETANRQLPKAGTLKVNGLKEAASKWAVKYSWESGIQSVYLTSNSWDSIINNLTGIKVGDRANGIITLRKGSTCGFHYASFRRDAGSSNVYLEGIVPGKYKVTCDKLK